MRCLIGVLVCLAVVQLASFSYAEEVVGCGGFVQVSDALKRVAKDKVDFSAIQLKLYTAAEGVLKHSTECAPSGYYFIPTYERGTFSLEIEGPSGWSFDPKSVTVVIGEDNLCHGGMDINFVFTGFKLSGSVVGETTCSDKDAPAPPAKGVAVTLTSADGQTTMVTQSDANGVYSFENVFPATYELTASHKAWTFSRSSATVTMSWDNLDVTTPFVVSGYDVKGRVESAGEPLTAVDFVLYSHAAKSKGKSKGTTLGCAEGAVAPEGLTPPAGLEKSAFCAVKSSESGEFLFSGVPCGDYTVVPFYKGQYTKFDVSPTEAKFTLSHGSYKFGKPFVVRGFTVTGRVVDLDGSGVAGARITFAGDDDKTTTDAQGYYTLDHVEVGEYDISAVVAGAAVDGVKNLRIAPNVARLPDITVVAYDVCGSVSVDSGNNAGRTVTLSNAAGKAVYTATTAADGSFCVSAAPGDYTATATVSASERAAGVLLVPADRPVSVKRKPVSGVVFSQAQVSVSGRVVATDTATLAAADVSVELAPSSGRGESVTAAVGADGSFTFDAVLPGSYALTVNQPHWCWDSEVLDVEVGATDVTGLEFVQKGYLLTSVLSHDITLLFGLASAPQDVKVFNLTRGRDRFCLLKPGVYNLTPQSCYRFDKEVYTYDTAAPAELELVATHFRVDGSVVVSPADAKAVKSLSISVTNAADPDASVDVVDAVKAKKKNADGKTVYEFSVWAEHQDRLVLQPLSDTLLFYPASTEVALTTADCPAPLAPFESRAGLFVSGSVKPATAGVVVEVLSEGAVVKSVATAADGTYSVGPLYDDREYSARASMDGFHFAAVSGGDGFSFEAVKLGELAVDVTDSSGSPVSGVLLSLSGDGYRSNNATGPDGHMVFGNLFPGDYYLRPMLKEYTFEPATAAITIGQGSSVAETFAATRVAFSIFGSVRYLDGGAESRVAVEAVDADSGAAVEVAQTDSTGAYRLRGLSPGSNYAVRVRADGESPIERASPAAATVTMTAADVTGVDFTAFSAGAGFRISGSVAASGGGVGETDAVDSLTAEVTTLEDLSTVVAAVRVGRSGFFDFPSLARGDYVVTLRSSLPRGLYDFVEPDALVDADSVSGDSTHLSFEFVARPKGEEAEEEDTFWVLSLGVITVYAGLNYSLITTTLKSWREGNRRRNSARGGDDWAVGADGVVAARDINARAGGRRRR